MYSENKYVPQRATEKTEGRRDIHSVSLDLMHPSAALRFLCGSLWAILPKSSCPKFSIYLPSQLFPVQKQDLLYK